MISPQNPSGAPSAITLSSFFRETAVQFLLLVAALLLLPLSVWILPPLVLISSLVVGFSIWSMHRLVGVFNFRQVTIPTLFFLMYVAIILVPGFSIYHDEITASRGRFLVGIESVLVTVPVGIWLANLFCGFRKKEIAHYFQVPIAVERIGKPAKHLYIAVLLVSLGFVLLNLWETPEIPLLYLLRHPGDFLQVALLREESFKLLTSHYTYIYYVVRTTVLPFLILIALGRYLHQKDFAWRRFFLVSLVLGTFYASITVEKSPVAAIFAMIGIFYYLFEGGKLGKTAAVLLPLLFFLFPVIVILLAYNGSQEGSLGAALQAMAARIFYSPAQVVYAYFEVFPGVLPFQHGASLLKLAYLMGWKTIDIPNFVGVYMTDGRDLATITANSCFIGNFNADFGLPGVVLSGILAGFVMQVVNIYFCRRPKTVIHLAAYAISSWAFGMLVTSALSTQLLSGGVTFALLLLWLFRPRQGALPIARSRPLPSSI